MPGDVVELVGEWFGGNPGATGVIGGVIGEPEDMLHVVFNCSAFRGKNSAWSKGPEYVSCSGGPGTIALPAALLQPTGRTISRHFWRWKGLPCADGGEDYTLTVPLWTWDGQGY